MGNSGLKRGIGMTGPFPNVSGLAGQVLTKTPSSEAGIAWGGQFKEGLLAARPTATGAGVGYYATDTNTLYIDTAAGTWSPASGLAAPSAPRTVTANTTLTALDSLVLANAVGGAFTLTLPASPTWGVPYAVMKSDVTGNVVTVAPGAGVINGLSSLITGYEVVQYIFDGTNWDSIPFLHAVPVGATIDFNVLNPPTAVVQGTTTIAYAASYHRGAIRYNNSNASGDGAYWASPLSLGLGNWVLTFQYQLSAAYGIMTLDISFDSGSTWTSLGTVDGYLYPPPSTASKTFAFSNTEGAATAWFRVRVLSKNASSTGYYYAISSATIAPGA